MANTFLERVDGANKRIGDIPERMLASGLLQPMANSEAGVIRAQYIQ